MQDVSTTYRPEATRRDLLEAAHEEIWRCGFRSASVEQILTQTGVTKGALYHHFRNKLELGYAVVDEIIRALVEEQWIAPLLEADDPISALQQLRVDAFPGVGDKILHRGCPLGNLAQEMSGIDEGFRLRIHDVLMVWRDGVANALRQGQARGQVRENIEPDQVATFILAVLQGTGGLVKSAQDAAVAEPCTEGLHHFLEALRPRRGFRN